MFNCTIPFKDSNFSMVIDMIQLFILMFGVKIGKIMCAYDRSEEMVTVLGWLWPWPYTAMNFMANFGSFLKL